MLVLGLQGSPRKRSNTEYLLSLFLDEAKKMGAKTRMLNVCQMNIEPCRELITCERKGFCPIQDEMDTEVFPWIRKADVVIPASPVFFYNVTAQLKALIDRSQTLWARKYRLNLTDPNRNMRRGFMLSQGATRGKNLFVGIDLTAKYFFDAIGASDEGNLYYWQIEHRGDMEKHPTVQEDVKKAAATLYAPFLGRKRVLFVCRENACRSQMAAAFAQYLGGDRVEVVSGGSEPAGEINPVMEKAMAESGIDMAFRTPQSIEEALAEGKPEMIITMGCGDACPAVPGAEHEDWDLPDPATSNIGFMRTIRDEIEQRVTQLLKSL